MPLLSLSVIVGVLYWDNGGHMLHQRICSPPQSANKAVPGGVEKSVRSAETVVVPSGIRSTVKRNFWSLAGAM